MKLLFRDSPSIVSFTLSLLLASTDGLAYADTVDSDPPCDQEKADQGINTELINCARHEFVASSKELNLVYAHALDHYKKSKNHEALDKLASAQKQWDASVKEKCDSGIDNNSPLGKMNNFSCQADQAKRRRKELLRQHSFLRSTFPISKADLDPIKSAQAAIKKAGRISITDVDLNYELLLAPDGKVKVKGLPEMAGNWKLDSESLFIEIKAKYEHAFQYDFDKKGNLLLEGANGGTNNHWFLNTPEQK